MGTSHITGKETVLFVDNISMDGTERDGALSLDGQLWIGRTAGSHVVKGTLTSPDGSVEIGFDDPNITLQVASADDAVLTLTGNSGGAVSPILGNINTIGSGNINAVGSGNTITHSLTGLGATDNAIVRTNGTSGNAIQNSTPTINDSGFILAPDGAVGTPTYSFTSDTDSGMWLDTKVNLSHGGTAVLSADASNMTIASTNTFIQKITMQSALNSMYVNAGASPYTATAFDYYISVDTTGAYTINLPNAPDTGRTFIIKDRIGNAAAQNITVTTPGGTVEFDGATSYVMSIDYESRTFVFNGTNYEVN